MEALITSYSLQSHRFTHTIDKYNYSAHEVLCLFTSRCQVSAANNVNQYSKLTGLTSKLLNCCWTLPAQWFLVPNPTRVMTIFYCLTALGAFRPLSNSLNWSGRVNYCWPSSAQSPWYGPNRKHRFQHFLYCCVLIRCRGKMITAPTDVSSCSTIPAFSHHATIF
jgi:hypothetical protein